MLSDSTRVRWPPLAGAVAAAGGALVAAGAAIIAFADRPDLSIRVAAVTATLVGFTAIVCLIVWNYLRGEEWSTGILLPDLPAFAGLGLLLVAAPTLLGIAGDSGEPGLAYPLAAAVWLGLLAACGAYWWRYGAGHLRSRASMRAATGIGDAGAGWVHVAGEAFLPEGAAPRRGLDGKPCVWYRVTFNDPGEPVEGVEETPAVDATQSPFAIRDDTGTALVLPPGADFLGVRRARRSEGDWEWIAPGDRLHVVGHLALVGEHVALEEAVARRLVAWREDPARRAAFDANGDGRLDTEEDWAMRAQALAEAEAEARAAAAAPPARVIGQGDGSHRLLVSGQPPKRLAGRFRFWAKLGAASFAAGLSGAAALALWLLAG